MVLNGIGYRIVGVRRDAVLKQWVYDLRENDGDGQLLDVLQPVLESLAKFVPECSRLVMEKLDDMRQYVGRLGTALHDELRHVEAMQLCRVYDTAAKDLAQMHMALGHMNSVRVWIENAIGNAAHILEGEDETEDPGEPPANA